jgi:PKD repeat protein
MKKTTPFRGRDSYAFSQSKRPWLLLFILTCFSYALHAQDPVMSIWFGTSVGCTEGYNPREDNFEEFIASGECLQVCRGSVTTYSVNSNIAPSAYLWNIQGGTLSSATAATPTVTWGNGTSGLISVRVTVNGQNYELGPVCVELIPTPSANFTIAPAANLPVAPVCLNTPVNFVNLSNANGGTALASYFWDFGDGTFSSEFSPTHTYTTPGNKLIRLVVYNQCSCSSSRTYTLTVSPGNGVEIECPGVVCQNQVASYTVPSNMGCSTYNWTVTGGTIISPTPYGPSIQVRWTATGAAAQTGEGYVTFNAGNCSNIACGQPSTVRVPIIINNAPITGLNSICIDTQKLYKLPQFPATDYQWSITNSGGANASLVWNDMRNEILVNAGTNAGSFTLNCAYTNTLLGCGSTSSKTVTVRAPSQINGPLEVCFGSTPYSAYTLDSGLSATWTLRRLPSGPTYTSTSTSYTPTFTTPGSYSLTASGSNQCGETEIFITVSGVPTTPVISPATTVICPGNPTVFTDTAIATANTETVWQVDGGTIMGPSIGSSVTVVFNTTGPFQLRAFRRAIDGPQCLSAQAVRNFSLPVISTVVNGDTTVCGSTSQTYSAAFAGADNYIWSIDPPTAGSVTAGNGGQSVQVLWNNSFNSATVKVKIQDCSLQQDAQLSVAISNPSVTINPLPAYICSGTPHTFSVSTSPAGISGTVTWDFGDGTTGVGTSVSHEYELTDNDNVAFPITVTITNPNGCPTPISANATAMVYPSPVAVISPVNPPAVCNFSEYTTVQKTLTATISAGYGALTTIQWYYNGNPVSGAVSPTYVAAGFGQYYAIVSNGTCTNTTNTVTFIQKNCTPVPGGPGVTCPAQTITLTPSPSGCLGAQSTASYSGTPSSFSWSSVPGISTLVSSSATQANFTYTQAGLHVINYQATFNNCTYTAQTAQIVPWIAGLNYRIECGPGSNYTVVLLDTSDFFASTPITSWQFYEGGTLLNPGAAGTNTLDVTVAPGSTHTYTLVISSPGSGYASCSASVTLTAPPLLTSTFSIDGGPYCINEPIQFNTPNQSGVTFDWDFNGEFTNSQQNPSVAFETAGYKNITLVVKNSLDCEVTSVTQTILVTSRNLSGTISPSPSVACQGTPVTLTFTSLGPDPVTGWQWMRNDQPVGTNSSTFTTTLPGSYWIKVSNGACFTDIYSPQVPVSFINPPQASITGPNHVCQGEAIVLTANGGTDLEYEWQRDGVVIATTRSITETLAPSATPYVYTVIVKQPLNGGVYCSSSSADWEVTVVSPPAISVSVPSVVSCSPYMVSVTATSSTPGTFYWSNGLVTNGTSSTLQAYEGGPYRVTFRNLGGCEVSHTVVAPRSPERYLWVFPTGCYTICRPPGGSGPSVGQHLLGPSVVSFTGYEWTQNASTFSGSGNVPTMPIPGITGSYDYALELTNSVCSVQRDGLSIRVVDCRCNYLSERVGRITTSNSPFFHYVIPVTITNTSGTTLNVTVSTGMSVGVFSPSVITVPSGTSTHNLNLYPDAGFTGGVITLYFQAPLGTQICESTVSATIPGGGGAMRIAATADIGLIVAPNPAKGKVELHYELAEADGSEQLIVYDMYGRQMDVYQVKEPKGSHEVDLSRYADGHYIVVLKQQGTVIKQQNLIVAP